MERRRSATQPGLEEDLSRREFLSLIGDRAHIALLAHAQAG
jgi:hypothetical protein